MLINSAHRPAAQAAPPGPSERLRSIGGPVWSLVGIAVLVVMAALLLMVLRSVVLALVTALFLAIVFSPLVDKMQRRGLPRPAGAAVATLIVIAVGATATWMVVAGVVSQQQEISKNLHSAVAELQSILTSAGMSPTAADSAAASVHGSAATLLAGLIPALGNLFGTVANVAIGVFVALFTCVFLLKDGQSIAARARTWIPVPEGQRGLLLGQAATTIRRYFVGLTALGVFNAAVVGIAAVILGVPLVGTIAVITLLGSYVPYVGALVAGAFAVLIALGSGGTSTAVWMLLVVFLANGLMQNLVSPFLYGKALQVSPMILLLATLLAGALAGVAGVVLATPITAVTAHTARLLRQPRPPADDDGASGTPAGALPTPMKVPADTAPRMDGADDLDGRAGPRRR